MKSITRILIPVLLVILIVPACTEDEFELPFEEGFLEFSMSTSDADSPFGREMLNELPVNLTLVVSIEDESGEQLFKSEEFKLRKWDDNYITRPVKLRTGRYKITEYNIVDKDHNVLLAAPMTGAPLSYLSRNPLPISFQIFLGESTIVTPEVLATAGRSPQDFGFSQFSFEKVKTINFELEVFNLDRTSNQYRPSSAHVRITSKAGVELYDQEVEAGLADITIRDEYYNHVIIISKVNRVTYDTIIVKNDLRKFSSDKNGPLQVYLEDGLIFWNKLGSPEELNQSEVGPPLNAIAPNFAQAKFGNGIYPENGDQIATMAAGEFNKYVNNPLLQPWTFEVWYKPDYALSDNRIVGTVPNNRSNVIIANCWKWAQSFAGIRVMPIKGGYNGPTDVNADLSYYKTSFPPVYHVLRPDIIDNNVSWEAGDLVHLALVYDPEGYDGNIRFELYVNGVLHGHSSETQIYEYAEPATGWPIYVGGDDINRVSNGVVDNFKIYKLAKTNFDDRETE